MTRYLVSRLLAAIPVAFGVATVVFVVIRISGDPVTLMLGIEATAEQREELRAKLGLDQPIYVQYGVWISSIAHGDLGQSLLSNEPVVEIIQRHVWPTLILTLTSLAITLVVGVSIGALAATRRGTWVDRLTAIIATLGISMPTFWLGLIFINLFGVTLGWLPTGGMFSPRHPDILELPRYLLLPAITLALPSVAIVARLTRSAMLEVLGREYVRTARAKGLDERRVIVRHSLKNALIPVVTIAGLQFGYLLGGAIIVEAIFAWPGMGTMMFDGIQTHDFPLVQGAVMSIALAFVLVSLFVDLLYGYLNPRIRYG